MTEEAEQKYMKPTFVAETKVKNTNKYAKYICEYCGKEFEARISHVNSKRIKSCGCYSKLYPSQKTHGKTKERIYKIYRGIVARCNSKNKYVYKDYAGRGIKCEFTSFEIFYEWAIENGYSDNLTIERKDFNGNYSRGNCIFIPKSEQNKNKRNNIRVEFNGETKTIIEWAEIFKINPKLVYCRISRGVDPLEALRMKKKESALYLTHNGKTLRACEWEKEVGINRFVLYNRKYMGWSDERILTTPYRGERCQK